MNTSDIFDVNGYVVLKDFLVRENCDQLVSAFNKLVQAGSTNKDPQCPSSDSVYGAPVFDKLLVDLLPYFEQASGKRLLSTYSYARIYRPGEELHNHVDRESCEISATITIGFDGQPWPFFIGNSDKSVSSRIIMDTGDAVLYRGMDKHHWRDAYDTGKWQAQVFLHYVDADGPNTEWIHDKRPHLGSINKEATQEMFYWYYQDILPATGCDSVVQTYSHEVFDRQPPFIGNNGNHVDTSVRNVERVDLPVYKDMGARLVAAGLDANVKNWKFDITHANQCEFLIYPTGGRYTTHTDTFMSPSEAHCRKLTVLAFLNDAQDFQGGRFYLMQGSNKVYPAQTKGTILVFPSFIPHGVEDITSGTRYSAVCWMVGPWFK